MTTDKIYRGVCGKANELCLSRHLREEHSLSPESYRERCPNAPLCTPAFLDAVPGSARNHRLPSKPRLSSS